MLDNQWQLGFLAVLPSLAAADPIPAAELDPTEPIPAILIDLGAVVRRSMPVSSVCAVIAKPQAASTGNIATVTLTYGGHGDFVGDVELVVWLDTDERASVWIPSVSVAAGEFVELEVESGDTWKWDSVQFAWTRLFPVP